MLQGHRKALAPNELRRKFALYELKIKTRFTRALVVKFLKFIGIRGQASNGGRPDGCRCPRRGGARRACRRAAGPH